MELRSKVIVFYDYEALEDSLDKLMKSYNYFKLIDIKFNFGENSLAVVIFSGIWKNV